MFFIHNHIRVPRRERLLQLRITAVVFALHHTDSQMQIFVRSALAERQPPLCHRGKLADIQLGEAYGDFGFHTGNPHRRAHQRWSAWRQRIADILVVDQAHTQRVLVIRPRAVVLHQKIERQYVAPAHIHSGSPAALRETSAVFLTSPFSVKFSRRSK